MPHNQLKTVNISPAAHHIYSIFADEYDRKVADLIEASAYGLCTTSVIIPGGNQAFPWAGFRVVDGPGMSLAISPFQATSLANLAEVLEVFTGDGRKQADAA